MMTPSERAKALDEMQAASNAFYLHAVRIGVHPFIEFSGLLNEYIKACREAQAAGIDFSECNTHSGLHLPLESHSVDYINEKLECIFTGRSVVQSGVTTEPRCCSDRPS
jgi:hypothetical protein